MPNACEDILDALSTYLDAELDGAELREFESHLSDCDSCQATLEDAERSHSALRAHLQATPSAPELLQKRIVLALDKEDASRKQVQRRQWLSWSLPATASAVAAAALALFIWTDLSQPHNGSTEVAASSKVVQDAARQHLREAPLFVSGDRQRVGQSAASFLERPVQAPRFSSSEVRLLGWTPAQIGGKQSATFVYEVKDQTGLHRVHAHAMELDGVDMSSQKSLSFDGGTLWVDHAYGYNTVTFAAKQSVGYVFSSDMSVESLVGLVIKTDIVSTLSQAPRK